MVSQLLTRCTCISGEKERYHAVPATALSFTQSCPFAWEVKVALEK